VAWYELNLATLGLQKNCNMHLLVGYHNELWKHSRIQLKQFLVTNEQLCLLRFCHNAEQLNTIFNLLNHCDKNFNSTRYVCSLNKMYKYAQDLRDDYLLQLLAHKHDIEVWQTVADTLATGSHFERLKTYFRTNVSSYALAKQTGKKLLVKISPEQLSSFVDFLFYKIQKQIPEYSRVEGIGQIRKDIADYIFMVQWLEDFQPLNHHRTHITGLKKVMVLMDIKHENEKKMLIMSRININSKLQKEIVKQQLVETQLNNEISDTLKTWIEMSNKN